MLDERDGAVERDPERARERDPRPGAREVEELRVVQDADAERSMDIADVRKDFGLSP